MVKSLAISFLFVSGAILIIVNTGCHFLDSFEYTLTHDGINPYDRSQSRIRYISASCAFIVLAIIVKYFIIEKQKTSSIIKITLLLFVYKTIAAQQKKLDMGLQMFKNIEQIESCLPLPISDFKELPQVQRASHFFYIKRTRK